MVTNNFSQSSLDLNGKITLSQPTALVWGQMVASISLSRVVMSRF